MLTYGLIKLICTYILKPDKRLDPGLLQDEDLELVQDLVVAAANAALAKSKELVDGELEKITGGMKIPGLG